MLLLGCGFRTQTKQLNKVHLTVGCGLLWGLLLALLALVQVRCGRLGWMLSLMRLMRYLLLLLGLLRGGATEKAEHQESSRISLI